MEDNPRGVRKGAWTREEDDLLRECIEKYGEGKWHLVPLRSGLNRCRKSCRLRWLNYLRPNIKRGLFSEAEVDLLLRLHKLLGNKWSLIAGRLPGRTANDVKNYWNSHINKKISGNGVKNSVVQAVYAKTNVIKPRPLSFSNIQKPRANIETAAAIGAPSSSTLYSVRGEDSKPGNHLAPFTTEEEEEEGGESARWWKDLLDITEKGEGNPSRIMDSIPMEIEAHGLLSLLLEDI